MGRSRKQPPSIHPCWQFLTRDVQLRRPSGSLQAVEGGLDGRFALVDDRRPAAVAPVASPRPALRFRPAVFLLAALLLVLTATGTEASGARRPVRADESATTAQLAPTLDSNIAHLAAVEVDPAALAAPLDRDVAARAEIEAKLRPAIAKVDLDARTAGSSPPLD